MRTRCPVCSTVFRVTSEQLRLRAGKVRCGHCDSVFNAFEALLEDEALAVPPAASLAVPPVFHAPVAEPEPVVPAAAVEAPVALEFTAELELPPEPLAQIELEVEPEAEPEVLPKSSPEPLSEPAVAQAVAVLAANVPEPAPLPVEETFVSPRHVEPDVVVPAVERLETTEESTSAAREAGLVAARELSDTPAYNRWAAGALAGNGLGGFSSETERPAVWPFVLFSLLLVVALLGQLLYHFRTDLVRRMPDMAALYALAEVDVPLPQNSDLVAIESSDLQADNARGLFVLQATLRNRAAHAQAWPALELTLTDTHDMVVSRRVLSAAEYLRPDIRQPAFPANGELAIRLWVEAKEIGAAGYRLYVFYP